MPLFKTLCFLFILLAITTLVCYFLIDQYQQTGPELLTGNWNFWPIENSRDNISEEGLSLSSRDTKTGISAYQELAIVKPGTVLLVSTDLKIKSKNVITDKQSLNVARVILVQNDGKQNRWDLPHTVVALTGTHDWRNYRKAFTIAPETQKIWLLAQLSKSTGLLHIHNIHVYPVHVNEAYLWAKNFILPAWGAYFMLFAGSFLFISKKSFFIRLLLISIFISIIAGIALPGDIKNQVLNDVKTLIDNRSFKVAIPWDLSKIWHLSFFFLFGTILCVMMKKKSIIQTVMIVLMLATGTELTQLYIEGRTALLRDCLINAVGGIFGVILVEIFIPKQNGALVNSSIAQQ